VPAGEKGWRCSPPGRTPLRRQLRRHRRRPSDIAPGIQRQSQLAAFIDECRKTGTAAAEIETQEKLGFDTGISVIHPFDPGQAAGVRRQFRADGIWHRRGLRLPAHDQRDLDFARKYMLAGPRVVSPDGKDVPVNDEAYVGPGTLINSDFLNGMEVEAAKAAVIARAEAKAGARARPFGACATGASRASVTGAARSRSSTAMLAAWCRCRKASCRSCCPMM
jgi:hypothetical protein